MKRLPLTVKIKGTGLPGLTATLIKRTDQVAWYLRSDGYHEVFTIKTGLSFDKSTLMEYFPGNEDIGRCGICSRYEETAAQYYAFLCLGETANERSIRNRCHIPLKRKII